MKKRPPDEQHPVIKNWFLEMYPEVKQFGVQPNKEKETNAVFEIKKIENGKEQEPIEVVEEKAA